MMLEPAVQAHLDAEEPMPDGLDLAGIRAHLRRQIDRHFTAFGLPGPRVASVRDHRVTVDSGPVGGSITVRVYRPSLDSPLPAHVLLHGGGWATGSIDELVNDATARHRAAAGSCAVFAVEYRLAPEFPFPTAVHDVATVLRWIAGRASELGVAGDAGRTIAGHAA
jgi:acetyl esterase